LKNILFIILLLFSTANVLGQSITVTPFSLDNDFELMLQAKQEEQNIPQAPPPGATLH
jgi:hypothetical protein